MAWRLRALSRIIGKHPERISNRAGFAYREDDMAQNGVLTLRQVATRLDVSDRAVLEMLSAGTIKGQKVGSQWRFRAEDVEEYVNSQKELKESPRNSE